MTDLKIIMMGIFKPELFGQLQTDLTKKIYIEDHKLVNCASFMTIKVRKCMSAFLEIT